MNDRIKRLRKNSIEGQPFIDVERAQLVTQAYNKYYCKVSTPMLRALTFKYIMENKAISITADELIVGQRGTSAHATSTYPEICTHSISDLDILNSREKISYSVDNITKDIYNQTIIPFWEGRSIREKIFNEMSDQWKECYNAGIFTEFMEQRAPGHTVADGKIYKKGFKHFIEDIDESIKNIDEFNDKDAYDKLQQLKAMKICAQAIIILGKRYSALAFEMADKEINEIRKAELKQIGQICNNVPENPPTTFHEALQMYWFLHLGVITELNTWDSFNPGRLDQHLLPFYKSDMAKGMMRDDFTELLGCFWVKFNDQPAPPKVGVTAKESGTYTDFANINIGGLTIDGYDGVNDVSYMLLDIIEDIHILQPSTNIQLARKNPDKFIKKACQVISCGYGFPSVFNADAVIEEMLRQGKKIEDARCGGTSGCVETGCFGKEAYILTGYFNLVKILEVTLNNGMDIIYGKQLGLKTGLAGEFDSFDKLITAYKKQLKYFIDIKIKGNNLIEKMYAKYLPAPFLSITVDDCIKMGVDYNAGGARYNTSYIQGVGIGTLSDSISAIKKHVFDIKDISMDALIKSMANNFDNSNDILNKLKDSPRYGNDDDYADEIMVDLFNMFYQEVNDRPNMKGGKYRIDMLPTTCHVYFGSVIGATPEGRLSGMPVSEGISPVQGKEMNGPTAVLKSAAKMDHLKTGGTLLNMKFSPSVFASQTGINKLAGLVRTYFRLDGHHIQFNVVNKETLLLAKQNPEKYKSLIVRVAGYSDYFCNLSQELQDEIIQRKEYNNI